MLKKSFAVITVAIILFCSIPATSFAAAERHEVLLPGDQDEWVMELQEKLSDLGYLTCTPTGYFGTNTQSAVIKFQQENELVTDGKAGPATRKALLGDNYSEIPNTRVATGAQAGSQQAETDPSATEESTSTSTEQTPNSVMLFPGDKGDAIIELQQKLKECEFYDYPSITGYFGPVTEEAVKKFQRTHNLSVDGIMGPASLNLLFSDQVKKYMMYPGDRSDDIKAMQDKLRELGYFNGTSTGYYGNVTTASVRQFQSVNGLTVDGKAGPVTRSMLFSENAEKNPSATKTGTTIAENNDGSTATPMTPEPTQTSANEPTASSSTIEKIIEVANAQTGKSYSYGASGPSSFDCSGFVYYVLKNSGVATSRLSSASYATVSNWDTISDINSLAMGDLVCFKSDKSSTISHIGIYLGGGSFIHSAPSSGGVAISSMSSGYYLRNFVLAKRIV
ncbi:peptidoglycan-binding protein [Christensenellaceae bacterium OttesenSCG-928-K19]|nr:peptidoglycan-binding protein [Christensenellaceae bacterium OttesenSCG-928-K19]